MHLHAHKTASGETHKKLIITDAFARKTKLGTKQWERETSLYLLYTT